MIKEVYYEEIDESICSPEEQAEFYYLYNLLGVAEEFDSAYIGHEVKQISIRNQVLISMMNNNPEMCRPRMDTAILGISPLHNKSILIVEC